jgi:hypothetical protein
VCSSTARVLRAQEDPLTRLFRPAIVLSSLVFIECGCGGSTTESEVTKNNTVQAAANGRIKFKDEYKQMLDKDGKMKWNPSTSRKRPPGIK